MTNFLVKFSISGLFVAIFFMYTHEGEGIATIPLFFIFLFVVILLNKLPYFVRGRVAQKLQEKQAKEAQDLPPAQAKKEAKRAARKAEKKANKSNSSH